MEERYASAELIQYNRRMAYPHPLGGVYAAAVTPLGDDFSLDLEKLPELLAFLAGRGCHGALLLGTTGEGPSFSPEERRAILQAALLVRQEHPRFRLLAGTGTPSLDETIRLTRSAFDLGMDGVVVLPPYYFRNVRQEGLFLWFRQVIQQAVPRGGYLLGYHIPALSGVPLSLELLRRLRDAFPQQFAGIKDSSGEAGYAQQLGEAFGAEFLVLNGTDRLFILALRANAAGCITALANLISPTLRQVWDAHLRGASNLTAQSRLDKARSVLETYAPAAPFIKAILHHVHHFPKWSVRPPLLPLAPEIAAQAVADWMQAENA